MRKKFLTCVSLLLTVLMLSAVFSSCGFGGGDSLEIEKITAELLNDGSGATRITIKYYDDMEEPLVFDIPMGLQGEDGEQGEDGPTGNGIQKIEIAHEDEVNNKQTLRVTYTDGETYDFDVKNGTKINSVYRHDEDGVAYLIITYSDGTESKMELPKGADGAPGVGIGKVSYNYDADGNTNVFFHLSDENQTILSPVTIQMGKQGEAGVGVTDISLPEQILDGAGNVIATRFHFLLSNGETTASIEVPAGIEVSDVQYEDMFAEDGVTKIGKYVSFVKSNGEVTPNKIPILNGVGVSAVENAGRDEHGNTLVDVILTDGTSQQFTIPGAVSIEDVEFKTVSGKTLLTFLMTDGEEYDVLIEKPRSIEKIDADTSDPNNYKLTIHYSDGSTDTATFPKTNAAWHTRAGAPRPDEGAMGDYWFDTAGDVIYYKTNDNNTADSWVVIVDFHTETVAVTVTFQLDSGNGEAWSGDPEAALEKKISIPKGACFATSAQAVPIPTRNNYQFAGWYTTPNPNPAINSAFTDLSVVPADITLYPKWIEA